MNGSIDKDVIVAIRNLNASDETARSFFEWAAGRTNDAAETSVDRISQITDTPRWQVVTLAKTLAEMGCGEFIVGRKGWRTRIRWNFSLKSLGRAARGEGQKLEEVDPELVKDVDVVSDQALAAAPEAQASKPAPLTIADAKRGLAESFGVSPDSIEIVVRA